MGCEIDWNTALKTFAGKVTKLKDNKYFIPKFISFQYGILNPENRCHNSVLEILKKEGACKGLKSSLEGRKDTHKDKGKVKDKKITHSPFVIISKKEQIELLKIYHKSDILAYVERLNDYGSNFPEKFDRYKSHATTVKTWMRKDKIQKKGAIA